RGERHRGACRHPSVGRLETPADSQRRRIRRDAPGWHQAFLLTQARPLSRARRLDLAIPHPLGRTSRPARRSPRATEETTRSHQGGASMRNNAAAPAGRRERVTIERTYAASIDDVWEMWTTKDGIESWWGPEGFAVIVRAIDLRPGGALDYTMRATEPG